MNPAPPAPPTGPRPGYLARTQPIDKSGVLATPASGTDVFSTEPETPSLPVLDPRCAPRPLSTVGLVRITDNTQPVLLGSLQVPNGELYDAFELQWWCDYPLAVELGFVQVFFRYGDQQQDVNVPQPLIYPARFCREFERGTQIDVFARISSLFPLSGALGTPLYIGFGLQLGWQRSQFPALALKGTDLIPQGTKRATVVVLPGSALANPFAAVSLVARRVRVFWPLLTPGAPAAGVIAISTLSEGGGPQAVNAIDQGIGANLSVNNAVDLNIGDMRELLVGNPAPFAPLAAPASLTVEWDQWRVR